MKKLRLISLILSVLLVAVAFAGCDKLKIDDVKANPAAYVTEGMRLTYSTTPFCYFLSDDDSASIDVELDGKNFNAALSAFFDAANQNAYAELTAKNTYDSEDGEPVTENFDAAAYYKDKNLVVKTSMLKDIVEFDALGVNLGMSLDDIKASQLYKTIAAAFGLTEEELSTVVDEALASIDTEKIGKIFSKYADDVKEISKSYYEIGEVREEVLTIGESSVKTFVVPVSMNEKAYDDIIQKSIVLVGDLIDVFAQQIEGYTGYTDEDIAEIMDEISAYLPDTKSETEYYISAKTGAIVKNTGNASTKVNAEDSEYSDVSFKYEINYGASPELLFTPSYTFEMKVDDDTLVLDGKSAISDAKLVIDGNLKVDFADEDTEDNDLTYSLSLAADSSYEFKLNAEEEYVVTGKIASEEGKIEMTADISDLFGDESKDAITDVKLVIDFEGEMAEIPEYKNILDITEEDIAPVLELIVPSEPSYETTYADDVMLELSYYYDLTEEDLTDHIMNNYESEGFVSAEEYMYALYANCVYTELVDYYDADPEALDMIIGGILDVGGTYCDIALAMDEAYLEYTAPDEDEVREFVENYEFYGFESREEVIDWLIECYGDYVTIPEEYNN